MLTHTRQTPLQATRNMCTAVQCEVCVLCRWAPHGRVTESNIMLLNITVCTYIYIYIYIYNIITDNSIYIYIYILEPWLSCAMCVCFINILTITIVVVWTMLPLSKSCSHSLPCFFFLLSCIGERGGGRETVHTHMPARAVHVKVTTLPILRAKSSSLRKTYM